jgi:hypothetical protein
VIERKTKMNMILNIPTKLVMSTCMMDNLNAKILKENCLASTMIPTTPIYMKDNQRVKILKIEMKKNYRVAT